MIASIRGDLDVSALVTPTTERIAAADGYELTAEIYRPPPPAEARGAALIVSAMGVSQAFYAAFAGFLAGEGFVVATFDYRGTGRSRRGPVREQRATILDWARLDCAAMLGALAARAPGLPITWIGHSLGGQILPFTLPCAPEAVRVAKATVVASGSGYWRQNPPRLRRRVWFLWYVLVPLALWLCGYFPGKRLRMVGDLPRGVMAQWRRWCLDPEYAMGAEGPEARALYAAVRTPLFGLSFTDDELMSEANTDGLYRSYPAAPARTRRLAPAEAGVAKIGHFGFFQPRMEDALWRAHLLPELAVASADTSRTSSTPRSVPT
jgi:predicted alpha/beta hydrolase